jgi:hypothetical protein
VKACAVPLAQVDLIRFPLKSNGRERRKIFLALQLAEFFLWNQRPVFSPHNPGWKRRQKAAMAYRGVGDDLRQLEVIETDNPQIGGKGRHAHAGRKR